MTTKPFVYAFALSLVAAAQLARAQSPAAAVEATAAVGLLPAAATTVEAPQRLDDLQVKSEAAPELTPAQRRAANRKAREELRRRFGPSIHVFN